MYNVNDTIIYGTQGACRIEGTTEKKVMGKTRKYYVLKTLGSIPCTIYAPLDSERTQKKMRCLLSADEIYNIIRSMPVKKTEWIENDNLRKEEYKKILAEGDRTKLAELIRSVYEHKKKLKAAGKKLHATDERFFKDAEKLLYEEFAAVLNIKPGQVTEFIGEQLGDAAKPV